MINTTNNLICLREGKELDSLVRNALDATAVAMAGIIERERPEYALVFLNILGAEALVSKRLGQEFLELALQFSQLNQRNEGASGCSARLRSFATSSPPCAWSIDTFKRGLRVFLVELWRQQVILLPSRFTVGGHFPYSLFNHELLQWIRSYAPGKAIAGYEDKSGRLMNYGPHVLFASNWACPEDVVLKELAELHRASLLYRHGLHAYEVIGQVMPFTQFASELLRCFPERVQYREEELGKYSTWVAMERNRRPMTTPKPSKNKRLSNRGPKEETELDDLRFDVKTAFASATTHEAVKKLLANMGAQRPVRGWREGPPIYEGREHLDSTELSQIWRETFSAFLAQRRRQGYSSDEMQSSLNLLAEYLFFYLPWWKELYPASLIDLPATPRRFTRVHFVARLSDEPIEKMPLTLLSVVKLRRPSSGSQCASLRHICMYFNFIEEMYSSDERVAGANFRSPLSSEWDIPKFETHGKTVKEVIPKEMYAHLVFYCHALEKFGTYLQELIKTGNVLPEQMRALSGQDIPCGAFGNLPTVRTRRGEFPMATVPNLFQIADRTEKRGAGETSRTKVLHLTVLRLLTVVVDIGLRGQSVQWLDRRTWDSHNVPGIENTSYALFVNTDKSRTKPWITCIMPRTREVLQRETAFQERYAEDVNEHAILYEGRESVFGSILPLFRLPNGRNPVRDGDYFGAWKRLMIGFEKFYRQVSGARDLRLYGFEPITDHEGNALLRQTRSGALYCPVRIETLFSVHSCRATFPSVRANELEAEDSARLLGHTDVETTVYYTKLDFEQMRAKLEVSDDAIFGSFLVTSEGVEAPPLRADREDSPLVRGFKEHRAQTINSFGFMPAVVFWSLEDVSLDQDGLELLQHGPMSQIIFHETHICPVGDECPREVVVIIGEARRCGLCPLAMKCRAHVLAIAAKRNQLIERARYTRARIQMLQARGEPAQSVSPLWEQASLDESEATAWKFSEDYLTRGTHGATSDAASDFSFVMEWPDKVKLHLEKVVRNSTPAEFLLRRIVESDAYPSMSSESVRMAATKLLRRLRAGMEVQGITDDAVPRDDIAAAVQALKVVMRAQRVSLSDIASRLLDAPEAASPELLEG